MNLARKGSKFSRDPKLVALTVNHVDLFSIRTELTFKFSERCANSDTN
jgi:hypothetical protein